MNKRESLLLQELNYMRQLAQEAVKEHPHLAGFFIRRGG
ncbi:type VI secretion system baseplate subunit TssF [Photorhabdus thracensis]|nr:type VI secretion system baseplate subunit TssF [Photorhabdus thracensis]